MSPPPNISTAQNEAITALNRAVFMRESQQAARALEQILAEDTAFSLAIQHQTDLARLLEMGNEPRLALAAYEAVLATYPDTPQFNQALRGAGHLSYRLKQYKKCRGYLERFLHEGSPSHAERSDAEGLLSRLPDGKGLRTPAEYDCVRAASAEDSDSDGGSGIVLNMAADREDRGDVPDSASKQSTWSDVEAEQNAREGLSSEVLKRGVKPPPGRPEREPAFSESEEEDVESLLFGNVKDSIVEGPDSVEIAPPSEGDAAWEEAGATPPVSMESRDLRSSSYNEQIRARDDGMEYALILPHGTRMSVGSVVRAMQIVDDSLSEAQAKQRLVECKGLLKGAMSRSSAEQLATKLASIKHKLVFKAIERDTLPAEPLVVRRAELLEPGLRLHTDLGMRKVKWNMIRLVNCGRIMRQPVLDLFCEVTLAHYRLAVPQMSFAEMTDDPGGDENEAVRRVVATISEHGDDDTLWSHPVIALLEGELARPQKFGDMDELDRYNRCLLLTHFGIEAQLGSH